MMIIGMKKEAIDTPALWVDLDLMEKNIYRLSRYLQESGVSWRPHIKSIKVPAIVHKLLDAGASGIACAKLGEAEVMSAAGVKDILIANQIVGPIKVARLIELRKQADVMPAIDSFENAKEISREATKEGVKLRFVIEVNTGLNRCGVEPGQPVVDLAKKVFALPGLDLVGVMTWEGAHIARIKDHEEKKKCCHEAVGALVHSAEMCREIGFEMPIVSCGGSGTYMISSHIPGVTEIQAGGAVFGALRYREWGVDLDYALFLLASVISRPSATRVIVDAGRKAMNGWVEIPILKNIREAKLQAIHAEHGILELEDPTLQLKIGDKIDFIPGWVDYIVNLHDQLYGLRDERVEVVWDIIARGKIT
jgi:D-serine deaminase-like pyridoxal phosphate-dependent protein